MMFGLTVTHWTIKTVLNAPILTSVICSDTGWECVKVCILAHSPVSGLDVNYSLGPSSNWIQCFLQCALAVCIRRASLVGALPGYICLGLTLWSNDGWGDIECHFVETSVAGLQGQNEMLQILRLSNNARRKNNTGNLCLYSRKTESMWTITV